MKKNKGFTLIELLTVIAILAVILLIAAPTILGVLEKSRKNNFKNQVLLYVEGLKQQVALTALNQADMSITLPYVGSSTIVNIEDIPMDTKQDVSGSIRISNEGGNYKYYLVGVQSSDYKVSKQIEAKNLSIGDIIKADGSTPSTPIYQAYNIGDQVTLKDNTVWYVIENSGTSSDTVTLLASQNIKNDASGWTKEQDEYKIVFDEKNARSTENNSYCTNPQYGCNIYAAQSGTVTNGSISGTVTEDSTMKKFLEGDVTNYINNSLTTNGGTSINSIRLLTKDEYDKLDRRITRNLTQYWTMTPVASDPNELYIISNDGNLNSGKAYFGTIVRGARPVIVTVKSNIQ